MPFYRAVLDNASRLEGENPALPFSSANQRTIVEYAPKESSKPICVATYGFVSSVLDELRNDLPAPDPIAKLLNN